MDLPKPLADKYDVQVVPMHVIMDGQDYLDGSLPVEDIYNYYDYFSCWTWWLWDCRLRSLKENGFFVPDLCFSRMF